MARLGFGLVASFLGGLGSSCGDGGPSGAERALDAAVEVRATGCTTTLALGAGAVLGADLVLTVAHVVAGAGSIEVVAADGTGREGELVAIDTDADLAIVRVSGLFVDALRTGPAEAGTEGVFVSYDDGAPSAEPFTVLRAVNLSISDIYDEGENERRGYELEAQVDPGDSGAVLVDADGRAIGIVFASSRRSDTRAWATAIDEAIPLLDEVGLDPIPPGRCAP